MRTYPTQFDLRKNPYIRVGMGVIVIVITWFAYAHRTQLSVTSKHMNTMQQTSASKTALFAGGCFWCVEADFEKLSGIQKVESGYAGGSTDSPTYENYAEGGHREVVEVTYDPEVTSYEHLAEHVIRYSDPTDATGSFHDRGPQYAPAIYYATPEEKVMAENVIKKIDAEGVYEKPLAIIALPRDTFWPAEEYHQDYASKNPLRYNFYRRGSGRDAFIQKHMPHSTFHKPSDEELRKTLTPLQYKVTQQEGTETPFSNEYNDNKAEGIYVDRISGEPLYSSTDKFDSGTGWPSFVKPINDDAVTLHEDRGIFTTRTEVRSRVADSHLGHVFDDGPKDRGGKRFCMNSAALVFIPKDELVSKGYEKYLKLFE